MNRGKEPFSIHWRVAVHTDWRAPTLSANFWKQNYTTMLQFLNILNSLRWHY